MLGRYTYDLAALLLFPAKQHTCGAPTASGIDSSSTSSTAADRVFLTRLRTNSTPGNEQTTSVLAGGRVIASPYAKKLAREAGVDISQATATGPEGRIVAADVQKLVSEGGGKQQPQQEEATSAQAPSKEQVITLTETAYH